MKRIILTSILSGLSIYSCLFFWPSLLNLLFLNNVYIDRGLSKIINMQQKDNLCTRRRQEHQQDQIEKKVEFQEEPPKIFYKSKCIA